MPETQDQVWTSANAQTPSTRTASLGLGFHLPIGIELN